MEVLSTNISELKKISVNGREEKTGFFKSVVHRPISLGKNGVEGDRIGDRVHHGGPDKACYLYSFDHYDFWRAKYPNLNWDYGMFGENLTVQGLNEAEVNIGDIFNVGTATVQLSQPRQPCYKLGVKFEDPKMVKAFKSTPYPGVYVRVLEEGFVKAGDNFQLVNKSHNSLSVAQVFELIYDKTPCSEILHQAINDEALAINVKNYLLNKHS
ncbi:MOSC domain-containing protein [Cytophagaceae bacterium ABcell3]|nr:MOSC domain-containing protein [Cytophagaceae bacterium ABcell3]